jgi:rhamnose utilization protein RhaD (predicted bifunctional aldolase and dehydrogenase)
MTTANHDAKGHDTANQDATNHDTADTVRALLERSNRLGADPRNTNYAGGNTSAKGLGADPVTGADTELLWVKGSWAR